MSCSLRFMLILLAVLAASAGAQAAGKPAHKPAAYPAHKPAHHTSPPKTNHYHRAAVHRPAVPHARHVAPRMVRQSANRTVHRYPIHRVQRRYVRQSNYFVRNHRYHRRYTHSYYPGRYHWRSNYYNRGYGRSRRHLSRSIRGIVMGVQGNAVNGMVVVRVVRPLSRRFRYATALAGANGGRGTSTAHRIHVNGATRYEILSVPRTAGTFASLHKGEEVLILKQSNQSNLAQRVEVIPRRGR